MKAFIVLTHTKQPVQGSHPGSSIWNATDKDKRMQITEEAQFLTKVPINLMDRATFILDYVEGKIVKNRYKQEGMTYDVIVDYVNSRYPDRMEQLRTMIFENTKSIIDEAIDKTEEHFKDD